MKRFQLFSLASAMLLASAAGFTSCSSDSEDPLDGGSGVAGQVVKTQFALNIPYGGDGSSTNQAKQGTRMTSNITQQDKSFRGISNIVLLTFKGDPTTESITDATSIINIGADNNAYAQDTYRRLYRDIDIPTGTSHIAFYGRASRTNYYSDFQAGKITDVGTKKTEKTLANISHKLTPIRGDANFTSDADANKIIEALNNIAGAKVTVDNTTYTWATIGNEQNLPTWLTDHEREFLKSRYTDFTSLRAGSKTSVATFIENLKKALAGETADATVPQNKKLTYEIYTQCEKALTDIKDIDFPGKFNLPDGVAVLRWNETDNKFSYNAVGTNNFITGTSIDYQKICYPAELSYFVNTTTMVSDKDMSNLNQFPTYSDWTNSSGAQWTGKTDFSESAVTNTTKTVGLKDPVQYSVAVLKSTIRCNASQLLDNGKLKGGLEEDQQIDVPTNGFRVTGILIGGQPGTVDWKYEPIPTETFAHTIYDKEMNGEPMYAKYSTEVPTTRNYTLVFDNKNTNREKSVYVIVELVNDSSKDFYGEDGIVLQNAKFYLLGKLDPSTTSGSANPSSIDRVFKQDYITTANFNIMDLKKAYNCIPDLRASSFNVGLAVDLKWQTGITFDVNL